MCVVWELRNIFIYRKGTVGFIVNNENKILIAKRAPQFGDKSLSDHWQLPQGGVDKGEKPFQTVMREMLEEVGLTNLEIIDSCVGCYSYKWSRFTKLMFPYKGQKQSVFILKHNGEDNDVKLDNHEFIDYKWVNKHHILELVHPYRKNVVKLALSKFDKHL